MVCTSDSVHCLIPYTLNFVKYLLLGMFLRGRLLHNFYGTFSLGMFSSRAYFS